MADSVINVRLQSAYKTAAVWSTLNPVLKLGEVGYESDTGGLFKIGNGTSTWNQLPYSNHRPLTNNDFDTANITDANVGNLVVTGAARFLNTIQGTAASAVNATSATSAAKLTTNAGGVATPVYFTNGVPTVVNGTSAGNWLINSLASATGVMTTAASIVTQQASAASTVYYKRPNANLPQYATASISGHTLTLKNGSGEVVTNLTLPDNNDTYKFATSVSGVTTAIAGLKANGASTFDTNSSANLATSTFVNPLINALSEGTSQASTADYLVASYVGAGTPTTTWHRRKASLITAGRAVGDESGNNIKSSYASSVTTADGAKIILKSKAAGNLANVSIATTAFINPMLDTLGDGTCAASLTTPIITGYAGTDTSRTNTYWKRPASLVMVGSAASATNSEQLGGHTSTYYAANSSLANYVKTASIKGDGTWTTASTASQAATISHIQPSSLTSGVYGSAQTAAFSGNIAIPSFKVDAAGHLTTAGTVNVKMPDNPNVDTKVTQTATTAKTYLIGNAGSATTTSGANLSTAIYMNNGNLVVGGSITIGGNNADTSGAKWQYDSTLESVSLVFA